MLDNTYIHVTGCINVEKLICMIFQMEVSLSGLHKFSSCLVLFWNLNTAEYLASLTFFSVNVEWTHLWFFSCQVTYCNYIVCSRRTLLLQWYKICIPMYSKDTQPSSENKLTSKFSELWAAMEIRWKNTSSILNTLVGTALYC